MTGVNLIPASRLRARHRATRLRLWAVVLGVYVVVLGAAYGWMYVNWGEKRSNWTVALGQAEAEIESANQALALRRASLAEAEASLRANRAVGDQPDWSMLLGLLARRLGDDIVLESLSLRPPESARNAAPGAPPVAPIVAIGGLARTHAAVSRFTLGLEETGVFSRVTLQDTRRTNLPRGEAVGFRVEAALGVRRAP